MTLTREQVAMQLGYSPIPDTGLRDAAASENKSLPVHRWVPWIAGFSADFVEDAIKAYLPKASRKRHLVVDPFAGVGTTLIESVKAGYDTVGYEINPFAALAANAKLHALDVSPNSFRMEVEAFESALARFEADVDLQWEQQDVNALSKVLSELSVLKPAAFRSRIPFFSPPVEAKFLYALTRARVLLEPDRSLFQAALGATMVSFSNYSYEPSLASRPGSGKALIDNASVLKVVGRKLREMLVDIDWVRQNYGVNWLTSNKSVIQESFFDSKLKPGSISLVVTSPPYMNNYHYVRNTRPQLYWLGLLANGNGTQSFEQASFGKFWQTVRQGEAVDLNFDCPEMVRTVHRLREKNAERGYYGGSGWANYVATYLNDSNRLISQLKHQLRQGGRAVIVMGNSIIQGIEFPVDRLLGDMAERQGLVVEEIRMVRTKRVGNSIIDSSVRNGDADGHRQRTQLYDAAVVIRR